MCLAAILFVTNIEFEECEEDGVKNIIPRDDYPLSIGKIIKVIMEQCLFESVNVLVFVVAVLEYHYDKYLSLAWEQPHSQWCVVMVYDDLVPFYGEHYLYIVLDYLLLFNLFLGFSF